MKTPGTKTNSFRDFSSEFRFSTSRSSGSGGQHVNKVETKVELRFDILNSTLLSEVEKQVLLQRLKNNINLSGELIIVSQAERSQQRNKTHVINKFYVLIHKTLTPAKKRVPTRPSRVSVQKRLERKRKQANKKAYRREKFY